MLNIKKTKEGEKLMIALEGRLDTLTSPDLETEFKSDIDGVKELVLDLEKLWLSQTPTRASWKSSRSPVSATS